MKKTTTFTNLRKIVHRVYCDDCNVELHQSCHVYASYPPQYGHVCPKCGKEYCFQETYPWSEIVGDEVASKDEN